jgi:plastocyanin
MRKGFVAMMSVLVLAGAACSKSSSDSSPTSPAAPSAAGCNDATATDLSSDDPFTVTIVNFAFQPDCFKAKSASSITIENNGTVTHTFTIDGTQVDVSINAGDTFNGESAGLAPGTYPFHCRIHTQMTGTVIVI